MPILNFSIRSQDIDFKDVANTDERQAQKTIKLEQGLKLKYLKLLHIYHNLIRLWSFIPVTISKLSNSGTSQYSHS